MSTWKCGHDVKTYQLNIATLHSNNVLNNLSMFVCIFYVEYILHLRKQFYITSLSPAKNRTMQKYSLNSSIAKGIRVNSCIFVWELINFARLAFNIYGIQIKSEKMILERIKFTESKNELFQPIMFKSWLKIEQLCKLF